MGIPPHAPTVIACCDWSASEEKQWMAVAVRENGKFYMFPPEPIGPVDTLFADLQDRARGGGVLVGFDFPIGLPRTCPKLTGATSFLEVLPLVDTNEWPEGEIAFRRCDRGAGANRTGRSALNGWRDVLMPSLNSIAIWPFQGRSLDELLYRKTTTVVEVDPTEAYRLTGVRFTPEADKSSHTGRSANAGNVLRWFEHRPVRPGGTLIDMVESGFGETSCGADMFDAVVGLMGMFDVVTGVVPTGVPLDDEAVYRLEGWILGLQHEHLL